MRPGGLHLHGTAHLMLLRIPAQSLAKTLQEQSCLSGSVLAWLWPAACCAVRPS